MNKKQKQEIDVAALQQENAQLRKETDRQRNILRDFCQLIWPEMEKLVANRKIRFTPKPLPLGWYFSDLKPSVKSSTKKSDGPLFLLHPV